MRTTWRSTCAAFWIGCFLVISTSAAVEIREGLGSEVELIPFFRVSATEHTLLTVTNVNTAEGVIARVFLRTASGAERFSFNIYLSPADSWVGAIAVGPGENAYSLYQGDDATCSFPVIGENGVTLGFDVLFAGPDWSQSGYIEAFAVGRLQDQAVSDCDAIEASWGTDGVWASDPVDGIDAAGNDLMVSAMIVDSVEGTSLALPSIRLGDFRDTPSHADPSVEFPTLADLEPVETPESDSYAAPIDAVSSLLMVTSAQSSYFNDSAVGAKAQVLFFSPTRRFYEDETGQYREPFDANGCTFGSVEVFDREGVGIDGAVDSISCQDVELQQLPSSSQSELLPPNGYVRYLFGGTVPFDLDHFPLPRGVQGAPVLPLIIQEFRNDDIGGVRANFITTRGFQTNRLWILEFSKR